MSTREGIQLNTLLFSETQTNVFVLCLCAYSLDLIIFGRMFEFSFLDSDATLGGDVFFSQH